MKYIIIAILFCSCEKTKDYTCVCLDPRGQEVYNYKISARNSTEAYSQCVKVSTGSTNCRIE